MTAEIVNLKRARKAKQRAEKERVAEANRISFGTPRTERDRVASVRDLAQRRLDGHKRDAQDSPLRDGDGGDPPGPEDGA